MSRDHCGQLGRGPLGGDGSREHLDWERANQEERAHRPRVLRINKKYILVSAPKTLVISWGLRVPLVLLW